MWVVVVVLVMMVVVVVVVVVAMMVAVYPHNVRREPTSPPIGAASPSLPHSHSTSSSSGRRLCDDKLVRKRGKGDTKGRVCGEGIPVV